MATTQSNKPPIESLEPAEEDELNRLGYNENVTPAERELEIQANEDGLPDEEPEDNSDQDRAQDLVDQYQELEKKRAEKKTQEAEAEANKAERAKAENEAQRVRSGEEKLAKATKSGGETATAGAEGEAAAAGAETATGAAAGAEAAGAAAAGAETAAAGAAAAETVAAGAAAIEGTEAAVAVVGTSEFWVPALGIIILVFLALALLIFAGWGIWNLLGGTGGGATIKPATASERQQVSALGALTGSQLADNQLVAKTIANEQARLTAAKATIQKVYASDPTKAAAASADLDAIIKAMGDVANQPLPDKRKTMIDAITTQLQAYTAKYPEVLGYGAVSGGYLSVPGVAENAESACGVASTLMVVLYYNPSYNNPATYNAAGHETATASVDGIVSPDFINSNTPNKDWTYASSSQATLEKVKKSLAGGDPVIVYTTAGSVYSNSKHIFVLVGYDPSDDTFIVNNPYPVGVDVHTKTPHNITMTATHLSQHFGDSIYSGHSYMIRKKYL